MHWAVILAVDTGLGWATNVIAIKMLTKPHHPTKFFALQGLIPSSIDRFADGIGKLISEHLLDNKHILEIMDDERLFHAAKDNITDLILKYVTPKEGSTLPHSAVREVVDDLFKNVSFKLPADSITPGSIEKAISIRIKQMPMAQIEALIHSTAVSEFAFIERVGAAIGFVIGLCQILIF